MKRRLLLIDIETAPAKAYIWRLFDENIGLDQLIEPGRIICWAAGWVGDRRVHFMDERGGRKKMLVGLADLVTQADAVITYNGDKFDLPKINGAMIEEGLPPLPPVASIDVIKTVKKMGAQSNKLAYIVSRLGLGQKVDTGGFKLWSGCLDGNKTAWRKMRRYNIMDVRVLGRLYMRLRPYMTTHPALGTGRANCPKCQSGALQRRGLRHTRLLSIERLQCQSCGGWSDGARIKRPQRG